MKKVPHLSIFKALPINKDTHDYNAYFVHNVLSI